jgi:RNA polymerase sigma-70 factor (ECF subfamily)
MARREERHAQLMRDALGYGDALYNFAFHLSRNATEAEDLVQETYARALAAAEQFASGSSLKAWLFRILKNTFIDVYRHQQRIRTEGGLETVANERSPAAESVLSGAVEARQVQEVVGHELERALMSLSEEARMVVLLDLEGFSEAEMAETLGVAAGTVKSRLFRARAMLRERVRDHGQ